MNQVPATSSPAIELITPQKGLLAIRKDAVITVYAKAASSRNVACAVNGIETLSGYDFVIKALGWGEPEKIP
jgi:hypothetical protein